MFPRSALSISPFKTRLSQFPSTLRLYSTMPGSDITLYTWPTPNGIKASIALEELGLPYKTEGMNISTNIQKEECDFLS